MRDASSRKTSTRCRVGAVVSLAVVCLWAGIACDGPPRDVAAVYDPCERGTRVGAISISLRSPGAEAPAFPGEVGFTSIAASITDGVFRHDQWITAADDGTCHLLVRPTCATACTEPTFCATGNRCAAEPTRKDVGTMSFDGLAMPLELTPFSSFTRIYTHSIIDPFPPAPPDMPIVVETSGGDYAPFSLEARAVEPLAFGGANLSFGPGRALDFTWTAPARPSSARIQAVVSLQPSVIGPRIECMFPDTGAASVPTALLDQLLELGVNGRPIFYLARRTVASTNIAPGCVELEVTAQVKRPLTIDGVTLCDEDSKCPPPQTCQPTYTCAK